MLREYWSRRGNTQKQLVCLSNSLLSLLHGEGRSSFLFSLKNSFLISNYYEPPLIPSIKYVHPFVLNSYHYLPLVPCTAWKESVFGVIMVRIFPHPDWITLNTDTFYAVILQLMNIYIDQSIRLRWWLYDRGFPGWNFNLPTRERFHCRITWQNQVSSRQGELIFHLVFV